MAAPSVTWQHEMMRESFITTRGHRASIFVFPRRNCDHKPARRTAILHTYHYLIWSHTADGATWAEEGGTCVIVVAVIIQSYEARENLLPEAVTARRE